MAILPDKREEELREMLTSAGQFGKSTTGMQEFPLVQDGKLQQISSATSRIWVEMKIDFLFLRNPRNIP